MTRESPFPSLPEYLDSQGGSEEERAWADQFLRDLHTLQRALAYYADPDNYSEDSWGIRAVVDEYAEAALRRLLGG